MLDPNLFRNDLDAVIRGLASRGFEFDRESYQKLDSERRRVIQEAEVLKAERNRVSEDVAKLKRAKENADHLIAQQREVGDQLKTLEAAEKAAEAAFRDFLSTIPNLPHESVPVGSDEHGNVETKRWGTPVIIENAKDHVDLGTKLGILDLDRAAKMSGARFSSLLCKPRIALLWLKFCRLVALRTEVTEATDFTRSNGETENKTVRNPLSR